MESQGLDSARTRNLWRNLFSRNSTHSRGQSILINASEDSVVLIAVAAEQSSIHTEDILMRSRTAMAFVPGSSRRDCCNRRILLRSWISRRLACCLEPGHSRFNRMRTRLCSATAASILLSIRSRNDSARAGKIRHEQARGISNCRWSSLGAGFLVFQRFRIVRNPPFERFVAAVAR